MSVLSLSSTQLKSKGSFRTLELQTRYTVRPRFYHPFRQQRNSDKIGVSDKIDSTWNNRKPPFFNYVSTFLCRDENAYHKFHVKITSYSDELIHIYCVKIFVTNFTLK